MYLKILIESELAVITGMHIGGSGAFSAIGAVDSPVVCDQVSGLPIIPGSSLKGKLRTLLARSQASDIHHMPKHNDDNIEILRLFGSSKEPIIKSRLQFADAFIINKKDFENIGITEVKFENTIDRSTTVANPRQIERVNPGVNFSVKIIYDLENIDEFEIDMKNLAKAMKLLQLDYLGGHGTRGYGRVSFRNIKITPSEHFAGLPSDKLKEIQELFKDVEEYELFSFKA
ncbi:MAG: CRISPR-associated protein Csm3 family [Oscillospiraceae bacterium]|jgi:CRISPR-associated protein Csm3|nr:CRISPR-associated protein Csm3 family [Oscillospiraceae bacterium]